MKRAALVVPVIFALHIVSIALAQSGNSYELTWNTIDGGGGSSSDGSYSLDGTIGQADAGTLIGGGYTLNGGFWSCAGSQFTVFLPLILFQVTKIT